MESRLIGPGEIDRDIDHAGLFSVPEPQWTAAIRERCEAVFRRYVAHGTGDFIPDGAFCDLSRADFLDYAIQHHGILLNGSSRPDLCFLEPAKLSQNLIGWNQELHMGFSSAIEAMFLAILDKERLRRLGASARTIIALPRQSRFYYGIDYRVQGEAPWREGTVYLYRRDDFPEDFQGVPFASSHRIRPVARVAVRPRDWPMLAHVHGVDHDAQAERQEDTYQGYPWPNDDRVHPGRWKRPLVEALRRHLEENFDQAVSLGELGSVVGVSAFRALRIFRSVMGRSPRDYQTELRIDRARDLLRQGRPIAEAALDVGFYDQAHLTRHFRTALGVTPGQYLRLQESPINRS